MWSRLERLAIFRLNYEPAPTAPLSQATMQAFEAAVAARRQPPAWAGAGGGSGSEGTMVSGMVGETASASPRMMTVEKTAQQEEGRSSLQIVLPGGVTLWSE